MPDTKIDAVNRRLFLQGATGVLSGVLGVMSPLAALVPGRTWAVGMDAFSTSQAQSLMAMIRTIAPHDGLDPAAYAYVTKALDKDASSSAETKTLLVAGLESLGQDFPGIDEAARVRRLQAVEQTPFFQSVRFKTLLVLYDNPVSWAHFGYEGEAFSKGGYLQRGFNDLHWLPEVPASAAGPSPIA